MKLDIHETLTVKGIKLTTGDKKKESEVQYEKKSFTGYGSELLVKVNYTQFLNRHIFIIYLNIRENRRGNQEWTIQRHWQHWAHKTQEEDKQTQKHNTAQETKKMSNTDPAKNWG